MLEVVARRSWISRMGGAVKGVIFGGLMFIIAIPVLFMNEGRAVRTAKGLAEGAGAVISVEAKQVDSANEGQLVHVCGTATTSQSLSDEGFGITYQGIRLNRHVEMYQWVQNTSSKTKKKLGGGTETVTVFDYEKQWSSKLNNSTEFEQQVGHENPTRLPFEQFESQAPFVALGAFGLPTSLVDKIEKPETVKINIEQLPDEIAVRSSIVDDAPGGGNRLYIANVENSIVGVSQSAQVGDIRVWFTATPETDVSVMARQVADSFEPYQTHSGTQLNMLSNGIVSSELMIASAEAANVAMTWMLRLLGIAMMCGGIALVLRPLAVLGDVVPFVGSIIGIGTSLIAAMVGSGVAFCTISFAWVFYRPLIGLPLLVLGIGLLVWTAKTIRSRRTDSIPTITPEAALIQ